MRESTDEPEVSALEHYEADAQRAFNRSHAEDLSDVYAPFLALLPEGARVLDAGCGSGRDSRAFLERGHDVTEFDSAAGMAEIAARHMGRPVLRLRFQDVCFDGEFDGVCASKSLLHVARRAFKPGGVLYASFMVGEGERRRGALFFNDYMDDALERELAAVPDLTPLTLWRTEDPPRPGRASRGCTRWREGGKRLGAADQSGQGNGLQPASPPLTRSPSHERARRWLDSGDAQADRRQHRLARRPLRGAGQGRHGLAVR